VIALRHSLVRHGNRLAQIGNIVGVGHRFVPLSAVFQYGELAAASQHRMISIPMPLRQHVARISGLFRPPSRPNRSVQPRVERNADCCKR
jgi:hypothetical protein